MTIDESMRKHIAQELRINQSSQCPYVVICYQSFFENGAISIILEYMDGGSLADFLKKVKTIPERYLAVICKQVASEQFEFRKRRICSSTNFINLVPLPIRFSKACRIFIMKSILFTGI